MEKSHLKRVPSLASRDALTVLLYGLRVICATDQMIGFQEGYLKTRCARILLENGFTLAEPSSTAGRADTLTMKNGNVEVTDCAKASLPGLFAAAVNTDLRVRIGALHQGLQIELKCWCDFGSKANITEIKFKEDIHMLLARQADIALQVHTEDTYNRVATSFALGKLLPPAEDIVDHIEWSECAFKYEKEDRNIYVGTCRVERPKPLPAAFILVFARYWVFQPEP